MNALVSHRTASATRPHGTRRSIIRTLLTALVLFTTFVSAASAWPIIRIKLGNPVQRCTGLGICRIDILRSEGSDASTNRTFVIPHMLESTRSPLKAGEMHSTMTLSLQDPIEGSPKVLPIQEPVTLSPEAAREVGAEEVVVLPGEYPVDYSNNPNGDVTVNVLRTGISIGIDIGRKSRDCRGFGVCSVWVDINLNATTRGIASIAGDKIRLRWHGDSTPVDEPFIIDEDITVSPETARAMGLDRLVLKRGAYQVAKDADGSNVVLVNAEGIQVIVDIKFGRASRDCRGFGVCSIVISFDIATALRPGTASLAGNKLTLRWQADGTPQEDVLPIDEDITLDDATAHALGARGLTLKKGAYQVQRGSDGWNTVVIAAQRIGITIDVEIGRKSRDCRGFGICSIVISADLNANALQAQAVLTGNTLSLFFNNPLNSDEKALVIDEDIVLDPATARALGASELKVKRGAYQVKRNDDGTSSVDLQMQRIGVTVNIEVGRRSRGCTGFGICSITIILDLKSESHTGLARVKGNMLTLSFNQPLNSTEEALVIDEDITLDSGTSRALGSKSLTVKHGTYRVRRAADGTAEVDVEVMRNDISITIYIGRRSQGCRGFGICGIVLEDHLAGDARTVQAIATKEGGVVELDLLDGAEEPENVLTIDEPVELDSAAAAALGVTTILPGMYPVDYDANTNGTVRVMGRTENVAGVEDAAATNGISVAPNPATHGTTFSFTLPVAGPVTLTVTDMNGREIARPIDGTVLNAGEHHVRFNAGSLAGGTYLYTMQSPNGTVSGRLVVQR